MADDDVDTARAFHTPSVGPYENWIFGPVGSLYAGPDGQGFSEVACLAEMSTGFSTADAIEQALNAAAPTALPDGRLLTGFRVPSLWEPAFAQAGPSGAHIAPAVAMVEAGPAARLSTMSATLAAEDAPPPPPRPEYGYRLNAPLRPGAFDPGFVDAQATLAPAPAVAAKVAAHAGPGVPLVILAVIEDGLGFAHPHLRGADGAARVEAAWLQGARKAEGAGAGRVLFGREWRREEIEALAEGHRGDPAGLYAQAGSLETGSGRWSPMRHAATHGSIVLDIAAGHRHGAGAPRRPVPAAGDLDAVRIVAVELPPAAAIDMTGFGVEAFALSAFHFIFRRADDVARAYGLDPDTVPLVINFSFGGVAGPQDGQDRFEEAVERMILARRARGAPTVLAMPSGNSFLAGLNGRVGPSDLVAGRAQAVWRVQPNDPTSSYLEIWYPAWRTPPGPGVAGVATAQPRSVQIRLPDGRAAPTVVFPILPQSPPTGGAAQAFDDLVVDGAIVGQVALDRFRGYRWRITVMLAPTETRPASLPAAPAGLWTIRADARPVAGGPSPIVFRIHRDERVQNPWIGGRQSRFDDPRDRGYGVNGAPEQSDAGAVFARRFGALNGFATHGAVHVVAGRDATTGAPAPYSSAGEMRARPPDAATRAFVATSAPADDAPALRGQRGAGLGGCAVARLVGVSAAAPHLARAVAIAWLDGTPPPPAAPPAAYPPGTDLERRARLGV